MLKTYKAAYKAGWRAGAVGAPMDCRRSGFIARWAWLNGWEVGMKYRLAQPIKSESEIVQDILRVYGLTDREWHTMKLLARWRLIDQHR